MRKRLLSQIITASLVASTIAWGLPSAPVRAAEPEILNEIGVEPRDGSTDMRCAANAPVLGAQDADQAVSLTTTGPSSVTPGHTFNALTQTPPLEVPTDVGGFGINFMQNIVTRTKFSTGATFVSVELVPDSSWYEATPGGTRTALPGTAPSVAYNEATRVLTLTLPGPYVGGSVVQAPQIRTRWTAGDNGATFTSQFAGTIPTNTSSFPWADPGFTLIVNANLPDPIGTSSIPTFCSPNYGSRSNIPANIQAQPPFLSRVYVDNQGPEIVFRTPRNNLVYDLDSDQTVDFQCVDPSGIAECVGTLENGEKLETDEFGTRQFTVTARDRLGFTREQTITYRIAGNTAPVVDAGADRTVNSNTTVTLTGSATDADAGQIVSYLWEQLSGPPVTLTDSDDPFATTNTFTAPPGPATLEFRLRADDGFATGEDRVTLTVAANSKPVITSLVSEVNLKTRGSTTLNATATDAEGYPLTYLWTQVDADGDELASDDPDRVIVGQPTTASIVVNAPDTNAARTLYFEVRVSDGDVRADTVQTVTVNVAANNKPSITAGATQTLSAKNGNTVTLPGTATDADSHTITYAWTQVDADGDALANDDADRVALSSTTAAAPTFSAPRGPRTLYFQVRASDPYETTTGTITVNVAANVAPVFNTGQTTQSGRGGGDITVTGSATDADGNAISYQWIQTDAQGEPLALDDENLVVIRNATSATATVEAPYKLAQYSIYLKVTASDAFGGATNLSVVVTVLGNREPVATAQTLTPARGVSTTVTGSGTDPDGHDIVGYSWTQVDSEGEPLEVDDPDLVTLSPDAASRAITFTTPSTDGKTLYFQLVVTDEYDADSEPALVTVTSTNKAPVASAGANTTGTNANVLITLSGSATDADGGETLSYAWTQVDSAGAAIASDSPIKVAITNANQAAATFTTPAQAAGFTMYFKLTVTDSLGATSTATRSVGVVANRVPGTPVAATAVSATPRIKGVYAQLTATAPVDPDGHPSSGFVYNWYQASTTTATTDCRPSSCGANVPVLTFITTGEYTVNGNSVTATNRQPVVLVPGAWTTTSSLNIRYTVNDGFGGISATSPNLVFTIADQTPGALKFKVTGDGSAATSNTADTAPRNPVWGGAKVVIDVTKDISNVATGADPDGPVTYTLTQYTAATGTTVCSTGTAGTTQCQLRNAAGARVTALSNTTGIFTIDSFDAARAAYFNVARSGAGATETATANRFTVVSTTTANTAPTVGFGTTVSQVFLGDGAAPTVTLDGTATDSQTSGGPFATQLNTAPAGTLANQTLTYLWRQTDSAGTTLDVDDEDRVLLSSTTALKPTFTAPEDTKTLYFVLEVSDGVTKTTSSVRAIEFVLNTPPSVQQDKVINARPGTSVTLNPTMTDSDPGQTLSYSWQQVDDEGEPITATVSLSSLTAAAPTFTAPNTASELDLYFEVTATDTAGTARSGIVKVIVAANAAPIADAGADQTGKRAGSTVTLSASGSTDGDGDTLTYSWTQTDGTTVSLTGATTATPSFTVPALDADETLTFEVTVTDVPGSTDTDTVDVGILANAAPVATTPTAITGVKAGATVTLDVSATDAEGNTISYAWSQVDANGDPLDGEDPLKVSLSSAAVKQPTFTAPGLLAPATLRFKVVPTDSNGKAGDPVYAEVSVLANQAPIAKAGPNQNAVPGGASVTLDGSGSSDPEGHTITYSWTQIAGLAVTLSSATAQKPTFTAPAANGLLLTFRLTVTDNYGATATSTVSVATRANRPPTSDAGDAQLGKVPGQTITLAGTGTDPDGHTLSYVWTQIDPSTGEELTSGDLKVTLTGATSASATFKPTRGGAYWFSFAVTDQYGATAPVEITGVEVNDNRNPVADAGSNVSSARRGTTVILQGSATDADNPDGFQTLTPSWAQVSGTEVTLSSDDTMTPSFTVPNETGDLVFRLTVTDGYGGTSTSDVTVTIPVNAAPVADAGTAITGKIPGRSVSLAGSAADAEGDALTYAWTQVDSNGDPIDGEDPLKVTLTGATTLAPSFTPPVGGTYYFALVVTDEWGEVSTVSTVSVTVSTNTKPVANAGSNQSDVKVMATVTLDGSASSDPDGHSISAYAWTQVNSSGVVVDPPTVELSSSTAQKPTFVVPGSNSTATYYFTLVVTDELGATSDAATVSISTLANTKPVASIANVATVGSASTVTLSGSYTDTEGHTGTYAWRQVNSANVEITRTVTLSSESAASPTFTAPTTRVPINLRFRLVVTDELGLASDAVYVNVSVVPNRAPTAVATVDITVPGRGKTVVISGTGSSDPDGHTLSYFWAQVDEDGNPIEPGSPFEVTIPDPEAATNSITVPVQVGELHFVLVVVDQLGTESAPAFVSVTLVDNNLPTASAGAAQTNKAANSSVTLAGTVTDPDFGETFTWAWTQVDAEHEPIADSSPQKVLLNTPSAQSTTFTTPTLNEAHTLHFKLVVTDSKGATSTAFTTVGVNANRPPTGLTTPTIEPTAANAAWRTVGRGIQLTMPTTGITDPDGNLSTGWTYHWVQTDASGNECAPDCAIANISFVTSGTKNVATGAATNAARTASTRQPIFDVPPVVVDGATLYFRAKVDDGFGGIARSTVVTVALTNSPPVLDRTKIVATTGQDFSVPRTVHTTTPCGTNTSNCQNFVPIGFAETASVYQGLMVRLDARTAATDPDGGPVDIDMQFTLPMITAASLSGEPTETRVTAGACATGARLQETGTTNVFDFQPSTDATGFCRISFRATDSLGRSSTWGAPQVCFRIVLLIVLGGACPEQNVYIGQFYAGNIDSNGYVRAANTTLNNQSDFWFAIKANSGGPTARVAALPTRGFNTSAAGTTTVTLDGSTTTDPDTAPVQPLSYLWEQVDPETGEPLADDDPDLVEIADPRARTTSFTAPTAGPLNLAFRLSVSDGLLVDRELSTTMKITTRRPVAEAAAEVDGQTVSNIVQGDLVVLDADGSTSPDGRDVTYEWRQVSGPEVELNDFTEARASFTAPAATGATAEDIVMELVVRDGYSAQYRTVTLSTMPVAGAPSDVEGTPGNEEVDLTWTAEADDNGSTTSGYRVQLKAANAEWRTALDTTTTDTNATVDGLTNGTAYTFRVAAIGTNGVGAWSEPSEEITPRTVPAQVEGLSAAPGNTEIELTWSAPDDGGAPITAYIVEQDTDENDAWTTLTSDLDPSTAEYTVTGLNNGSGYRYRVSAVNAAGTGAVSEPTSVVAPRDVPGQVTNVRGTAGLGSVALAWNAPSANGGAAISGYRIDRRTTDGEWETAVPNTGSTTLTRSVSGLNNGTAYVFRVAAINAAGAGEFSTESAAITPGKNAAPTNLRATAGNASVGLTWTAPPAITGLAILGYKVERRNGVGGWTVVIERTESNDTAYTVTGLTNGSSYTFRVSAVNARVTSDPSAESAAVTPFGFPGTPTNVRSTSPSAGKATITWTAPSSNGGSPITGYKVEARKGSGSWTVLAANTNSTSTTYNASNLTSGSSYAFRVSAINARGAGSPGTTSATVTIRSRSRTSR
jgi:hypothetical protein